MPDPGARAATAGAVLTGGASRRMGRDKAFVEVDGIAMVRRVAAALDGAGCAPLVAIGGDATRLALAGLECVPDRWPGEGPLGGIVTALAATRCDTVVVATDLPFLDDDTIRALRAAANADSAADVVIARSARDEPLCGLWRVRCAEHLEACFDAGERSVHRAIEGLVVQRIPVAETAVRNVNHPRDLDPTGAEP